MNPYTHLRINGSRLWNSIMNLANIGATPKGGVCRLALTALDKQGRDQVISWGKDMGCDIRIDKIGNLFIRYPGSDPARLPIMTGSHIDTQPTGGKFDGNYGVLAGLEVIKVLREHQITLPAPLEVAIWTNEEGSRFTPVMMGSGAFIKAFDLNDLYQQKDHQGITVKQALESIHYLGDHPVGERPIGAYFETHIEQGPILEDKNKTIGIVTGALGQRWYDVVVTGIEAHAGPTPMELRKDALLTAAQLIQAVNQLALDHAPHARGTVGWINNFPNSRNVIPGQAQLSVDIRAANDDTLTLMQSTLFTIIENLRQPGMDISIKQVVYFPPQPFDANLLASIRDQAQSLGYSHMDLVSGAGHDAVYLARITPTAMIFIPCKDGISHNEIEHASPSDVEAGANVLLQAMIAAAY